MKTCVSAYSFHRLIESGQLNQISVIEIAKQIGFDAIEFAEITPHDGSSREEYARKLRAEAERLAFPIACLAIGADLLNGTDGRTPDEEEEYVKSMVDIGEILGVKVLRHDVLYSLREYATFDEAIPELSERILRITRYAAQKNIKTCVENHGFICQDPMSYKKLVFQVQDPNFGLLCDIGNFLCMDIPPMPAVFKVAVETVHVHLKDFHIRSKLLPGQEGQYFRRTDGAYMKGAILGKGEVPVLKCLTILKMSGYDDYVSLEFEGDEDPIEGVTEGFEHIMTCFCMMELGIC